MVFYFISKSRHFPLTFGYIRPAIKPVIMLILKRLSFFVCLLIAVHTSAKTIVSVQSPDKQIKFWLSTDANGLFYKVAYKNVLMIDVSRLNINFKEGSMFNNSLHIAVVKPEKLTEDYE
jgi:hypothetical protein